MNTVESIQRIGRFGEHFHIRTMLSDTIRTRSAQKMVKKYAVQNVRVRERCHTGK